MSGTTQSFDVDLKGRMWGLKAAPQTLITATSKKTDTQQNIKSKLPVANPLQTQPTTQTLNNTEHKSVFSAASHFNDIFNTSSSLHFSKNKNEVATNHVHVGINSNNSHDSDPVAWAQMSSKERLDLQPLSKIPLKYLLYGYILLIVNSFLLWLPFLNYGSELPLYLMGHLFPMFAILLASHMFVNYLNPCLTQQITNCYAGLIFLLLFFPLISAFIGQKQFLLQGRWVYFLGLFCLTVYYCFSICSHKLYCVGVSATAFIASIVICESYDPINEAIVNYTLLSQCAIVVAVALYNVSQYRYMVLTIQGIFFENSNTCL